VSGSFLSRWSRRKLAASLQRAPGPAPELEAAPASATVESDSVLSGTQEVPAAARAGGDDGAHAAAGAEEPLPPVESLSLSSDFSAFLKQEVGEALRRKALHKLFSDPYFNRMDGLDIYIDDYSQPDPIPPEALAKLRHAREWLMANEAENDAPPQASVAQGPDDSATHADAAAPAEETAGAEGRAVEAGGRQEGAEAEGGAEEGALDQTGRAPRQIAP